jgi:acyl transferase domain-containing protein/NAD(P)-dependent dehydrogenase (short-subunit alcohol dehydrogenase family)
LALAAKQRRAESLRDLRAEPVAIVGMACRMPGGANTPERLWSLLRAGRETVGPVPPERWDGNAWYDEDLAAPGKSTARAGSFLEPEGEFGIAGFDAAYFGLSASEADRMDPQQRLLLEVTYEALDDAGLDRRALAGSRTGTFVGSYHNDYAHLQTADATGIELRTLTGTLHSVLAGRIAYLLDLRGPALAVDTACSASLVAIHLAAQSLRWGESDVALAGGVSLMLAPELMVMLSKVGFMAPDGRSKTFDAAADGFGRGEGCGMLVLKRLSDAIAAGDRMWAVIRGSAINQDGRSTLLTAPNGPAQEALIREALAAAQLAPERIGFVETHGTGTALGDPIEVEAIAAVLGHGDPAVGPCWLGGVKANLGHLEGAAGVAGVIKAALALHHGEIPPQPNFTTLNPHIELAGTRLAIPTQLTPWPAEPGAPRCAAVSAFGVGGTNAHLILEEPPVLPRPPWPGVAPADESAWLLPLSAKTPAALTALAQHWVDFLDRTPASLGDLAHSACRRTAYERRLAVVGRTRAELQSALRRAASEAAPATAPGVAFVFCGQGPQWFAMGRELLAAEPVFRDAVLTVDAALTPLAGWSLREELSRAEADSRLDQTAFAQPALFALQVALAALWRSWGVVPTAVVGHSVGEIAALHVAGVLDLEEAVRVVFHRGRIMQGGTGLGRMASLALGERAARDLIAPFGPRLSVAAVNAPGSVVLAGDADALDAVLDADPDHIVLPVNYAFHSAQMDPFRDALVAELGSVAWRPARIPVASTVTGGLADGVAFDAAYFGRNVRDTVRFADAVTALPAGLALLEIGPHPVLARALVACRASAEAPPVVVASLRRGRPERETLLQAAATLYGAGVLSEPGRLQPGPGRTVSLPAYPWQRRRHWLPGSAVTQSLPSGLGAAGAENWTGSPSRASRPNASDAMSRPGAQAAYASTAGAYAALQSGPHPLLGPVTRVAGTSLAVLPAGPGRAMAWLEQHRVLDRCLVPAAAVLEAFVAAATAALGVPADVFDFAIHRPIEAGDEPLPWQIIARPAAGSAREPVTESTKPEIELELEWFEAAPGGDGLWRLVAAALARRANAGAGLASQPGADGPRAFEAPGGELPGAGQAVDSEGLYARFAELGAAFGPDFRLLDGVTLGGTHATASARLPAGLDPAGFALHPVLLDAAVQLCSAAAGADAAGNIPRALFLPIGIEHAAVGRGPGAPNQQVRLRARLLEAGPDSVLADVTIHADDGTRLATLQRLRLARAERIAPSDLPLYDVAWTELPPVTRAPGRAPFLLFTDAGGVAGKLASELPGRVERVAAGAVYGRRPDGTWELDPANPDHFRRLLRELDWTGGTLVHCWSLDTPAGEPEPGDDARGLAALLHIVQSAPAGRLVVVTRGAQSAGGREPVTGLRPRAAALWGLAGVIRAEDPELHLRTIDLDPVDPDGAGLLAELLAGDAAPAVALRAGRRLRPVLRRAAPAGRNAGPASPERRLVLRRPGTFEGLELEQAEPGVPGPGEVRVRVHTAGLNFRDVLVTLGMYPGEPAPLGAECAGVVEAVGPGAPFEIGRRVFGCATASFASSVTVPAASLAPLPERVTMTDAATLPVAFLTAMYGFERLAGLRAGESVLIHAGAGGVGLAAVQLARRAGARVFATAGSPEKRALVESLGVERVFDSRSLAFADEVREATGGRGVDVLLNSLAGDFIAAGLRALAPGGRFLEIGKRDVWSVADMAAARPDVAYYLYDLGVAAAADATLLPSLFGELLAGLADGSLAPLPATVFPLADAAQAMRAMAQARHAGKFVLEVAPEPVRPLPELDPEATYWITGGLAGIGLETAGRLVERGARHLLLSGRSAPGPAARTRISELERRGVRVQVRAADAADPAAMAAVLAGIEAAHPLRGVVHAAGELRDGVLTGQDWPAAAAAMRGKTAGAWNLHRLTRRFALDFFIVYSAAATLLGARGQGLYPAANAELDALAAYRRRLGLPALSVAWGLWAGSGMAARASGQGADAWSGRGLLPLEPATGFAGLERLLAGGAAYGAVLPVDWGRFAATVPAGLDPAFFERVAAPSARAARPAAAGGPAEAAADILSGLRALPSGARRPALLAFLRERTVAVAGLDPATNLDLRKPLKDAGLDSLMAVELRNVLVRTGGRRLPAALLFDYPTLEGLTGYLLTAWELDAPASVLAASAAPAVAATPHAAAAPAAGAAPPAVVAAASESVTAAAPRDPAGDGRTTYETVSALSEAEAEEQLLAELGMGARS